MKVNITSKGFTAGERQTALIEKKFSKLSKFFPEDAVVDVTMGFKKNRQTNQTRHTMEAMIRIGGMLFRSEYTDPDMNVCLDKVVSKLSSQLSRYKKKLQKNHRHVNLNFDALPEVEAESSDDAFKPVKIKQFDLTPMDTDEAILQMEMLGHSFFVFLNSESDKVNVVYKRDDGEYGLLDPIYG